MFMAKYRCRRENEDKEVKDDEQPFMDGDIELDDAIFLVLFYILH